jgi:hypothetical protein
MSNPQLIGVIALAIFLHIFILYWVVRSAVGAANKKSEYLLAKLAEKEGVAVKDINLILQS